MKPLILCFLLLSLAFTCVAQNSISGKVIDFSSGHAIDYATVSVSDQATDKIMDGATADSSGSFIISDLPQGMYKVSTSFLGYNTFVLDSVQINTSKHQVELPVIYLHTDKNLLQEITISGSAPVVENKIDKIVYNAANDVTAQGGVALDVLKKVPQVSVDVDGNVELQGNPNIRFLINGKPSSVFGNNLADALASIPASQIKSIEAITSPGAKYDAQGTGGIINIILKDNKINGVNGSLNVSAGTRLENASANLNIRSGNFGINAFLSGNATLKSKTINTQDRTSTNSQDQTTTQLLQDGYGDLKRNGYMTGVGFDWNLSKSDIVTGSFQYSDFSNKRTGITNLRQSLTDGANNSVSNLNSISNFNSSTATNSFDWSLDYKHKFRHEGEEIEFNYNASFGNPVLQYAQQQTYSGFSDPYGGTSSYNKGSNNQTNISVDYVKPIHKNTILEAGAKSSFYYINSLADVSVLSPSSGEYYNDALQSYALKYKMNIYAGYVAASFRLLNYLNVKAGLRLEHTDVNIDYKNTPIPSYNTFVPSVIFSHNINDKQFLKLAYTHRIERPEYEELNPFLNLSDPYNIITGNPLLQPEIGDNFELGYSRSFDNGANFYIALSERINSNDIKPYTTFYPTYAIGDSVYNNVSVTNRQNIGMEYNSGLILTGSMPLLQRLNIRGNLMIFNRHIINHFDTVNTITNGINWRLNMNISYDLPGNMVVEAFGNYKSAFNNIQGRSPQFLTYTIALLPPISSVTT
jgi:ferric enterobactin receptor